MSSVIRGVSTSFEIVLLERPLSDSVISGNPSVEVPSTIIASGVGISEEGVETVVLAASVDGDGGNGGFKSKSVFGPFSMIWTL